MRKAPTTSALSLVSGTDPMPTPPRPLGPHGTRLWDAVQRQYAITDVGGIELLTLACGALDRAEALRQCIDRDGEIISSRTGMRAHPGIRDELCNRSFVAKTLQRLGLDLEVVKPVGRPPTSRGWVPPS
jgi:hypothetical protein